MRIMASLKQIEKILSDKKETELVSLHRITSGYCECNLLKIFPDELIRRYHEDLFIEVLKDLSKRITANIDKINALIDSISFLEPTMKKFFKLQLSLRHEYIAKISAQQQSCKLKYYTGGHKAVIEWEKMFNQNHLSYMIHNEPRHK